MKNTKNQIPIPDLTRETYRKGRITIRNLERHMDIANYVNQHVSEPPQEVAEKVHLLNTRMITSMPNDLVDTEFERLGSVSPYMLLLIAMHKCDTFTIADHKDLHMSAMALRIRAQNIDQFFTEHVAVSTKMTHAKYPAINEESTTVEIILECLTKDTRYKQLAKMLMLNSPTGIQDLKRKIRQQKALVDDEKDENFDSIHPGAASGSRIDRYPITRTTSYAQRRAAAAFVPCW